jgi:hypothetical protein
VLTLDATMAAYEVIAVRLWRTRKMSVHLDIKTEKELCDSE